MIIKKMEWEQIKWIPQKYSKGFAMFSQHKKPSLWLGAFLQDGEAEFPQYDNLHLMGVGKLLFLTKHHARLCSDFTIPMYRKMGVCKRLTKEREKIAIEYGCTKIDYTADASLEFWVPEGFIRKERRGNSGFRYEKTLKEII